MSTTETLRLADHTTSRVGGEASSWVSCGTAEEIVAAVSDADAKGEQILLLGGGSNLLVTDDPLDVKVIKIDTQGFEVLEGYDGFCAVRAAAGHNWDAFVAATVTEGLSGLEALSGIPGAVGATPVQNVGAYGAEVAQYLTQVQVYDRELERTVWLSNEQLEFGYRDSLIKRSTTVPGSPRYVVLQVEFSLEKSNLSGPVRYAELARQLGVEAGQRADATMVRQTVLGLRAGKGMVLDETDHDTWSTGSFFTNPIVPKALAEGLPEGAPRFPAGVNSGGEELVKLSAAWLIDHAGYKKGFALGERASLSTKHTLALTNRGGATCAEMVELATHVRDGVEEKFGIRLVPEPLLIGCQLG